MVASSCFGSHYLTLHGHPRQTRNHQKKKQKEREPADEGSFLQSNDQTLLKNGKADISILLQQPQIEGKTISTIQKLYFHDVKLQGLS